MTIILAYCEDTTSMNKTKINSCLPSCKALIDILARFADFIEAVFTYTRVTSAVIYTVGVFFKGLAFCVWLEKIENLSLVPWQVVFLSHSSISLHFFEFQKKPLGHLQLNEPNVFWQVGRFTLSRQLCFVSEVSLTSSEMVFKPSNGKCVITYCCVNFLPFSPNSFVQVTVVGTVDSSWPTTGHTVPPFLKFVIVKELEKTYRFISHRFIKKVPVSTISSSVDSIVDCILFWCFFPLVIDFSMKQVQLKGKIS